MLLSGGFEWRVGACKCWGIEPDVGAKSTPTPAHLVILVGSDGDEVSLWEDIGAEGTVRELQDVIGSHDVEARLVLVHGVQDGL